ncbi:MAG: hypothetical protein AAFV62_07675 [Pseudomonadota bacterium]
MARHALTLPMPKRCTALMGVRAVRATEIGRGATLVVDGNGRDLAAAVT